MSERDLREEPEGDLEGFGELEALFAESRAEQDPGGLFFEGLRDDVMAGLDAPSWEGRKVEEPEAAQGAWGLWTRARAWWGQRVALSWALVMAAALVGVIAWPKGEAVAPKEAAPAAAQAPREAPDEALGALVPHSLGAEEVEALRELSGRLRVDLGDEGAGGWAEAEPLSLEVEPAELGGASPEVLEDMEAVWERSL